MRANVAASIRLGVSLVLMLALVSVVAPAVAAQNAATPVALPIDSAEAASLSVTVSCTPDAASAQTACTFTSSNGATLIVPAAALCAPVAAVASGAIADGAYSGAGQVSLVLQGSVSVAGAAPYSVLVDGTPQDVPGAGLSCIAADTATGDTGGGAGSSPDTGDGDQAGVGTTDQSTDGGDQNAQSSIDEDASGTPETGGTTTSNTIGDGDPVSVSPATDGTAGAAFTAAASPVPVTTADEPAASVDVALTVYNCTSDPGAADPATFAGCSAAQGVTITASQDGTALPAVFTDATGSATISATDGSSLVLTEDQTTLPSGYVPLGNGVQIVNPVSAGATAVFVNIADSGTGHLQIVSGTCPTAGQARTEFRIIGARTFGAAATACTPTPGASFTLTGGNLGPAGLVVTTGDDASWRGFMPVGAYTVMDGASSSDPFDVVADAITAVIVIDYVPMPRGSLVVTRVLCTEGAQEGTTITVGDSPQTTGGPGCAANDSDFQISNAGDGTSGPSQDFTLGSDGSAQVDLTAGSYLLTDLASGQHTTITVSEGGTTVANVRQIVLTGRAIVRHYFCADPASNDADPSDASYFSDFCTQPLGGATLTLLDSGGNAVSTETASGGGIITWSGLVPGSYSVASDSGLCAVFAEGSDARGGFTVTVGRTTMVNVYSCAAPVSDGSGAGDSGGGTNDGGIGDGTSGGVNTGDFNDTSANASSGTVPGSAGDELKNVTQLPSTGIGETARTGGYQLLGAFLIVLALAGASMAASKRRSIHSR
jgi:hypothetical protein